MGVTFFSTWRSCTSRRTRDCETQTGGGSGRYGTTEAFIHRSCCSGVPHGFATSSATCCSCRPSSTFSRPEQQPVQHPVPRPRACHLLSWRPDHISQVGAIADPECHRERHLQSVAVSPSWQQDAGAGRRSHPTSGKRGHPGTATSHGHAPFAGKCVGNASV